MSSIVGWDIGGANLKAALLDSTGKVIRVLQLPCELWRGLNQLELAMRSVLEVLKLNGMEAKHAVTMTGEMVDLFTSRHDGVMQISALVADLLGSEVLFYGTDGSFVNINDVFKQAQYIASSNWHASANVLAKDIEDALFVDIGSTTTDIIVIEAGEVKNTGLTDAVRMQNDSLIYTGVIRTPIMALGSKVQFEGIATNVAAEYFATMADVYRLTRELPPAVDVSESADTKGKTPLESARRLARMIGYDVEGKPIEAWINLAKAFSAMQLNQIKTAVLKYLKPNAALVGAGVGSFLVKALASELNHPYESISIRTLNESDVELQNAVETCFPAYAVAKLAQINFTANKHA
jgi:(4-(4-[2-(gamma-L-glutamylamino)ethyl]phenoxymethyl)furan-2-yl)methanamine synthase